METLVKTKVNKLLLHVRIITTKNTVNINFKQERIHIVRFVANISKK